MYDLLWRSSPFSICGPLFPLFFQFIFVTRFTDIYISVFVFIYFYFIFFSLVCAASHRTIKKKLTGGLLVSGKRLLYIWFLLVLLFLRLFFWVYIYSTFPSNECTASALFFFGFFSFPSAWETSGWSGAWPRLSLDGNRPNPGGPYLYGC